VEVEPGTDIVREGDEGDSLYLLEDGSAEVFIGHDDTFGVKTLGPGDSFGVMALLEGEKRTASVRARTRCSLYCLSKEALDKLAHGEDRTIFPSLLKNLLRDQIRYMRVSNEKAVEALRRQLELSDTRVQMGTFITFMIAILSIYSYALRIWLDLVASEVDTTPVTIVGTVAVAIVIWLLMRKVKDPLSSYGLTMKNWKGQLRESLLWTAAFCIAVTVVKWLLILILPSWQHLSVLDWPGVSDSGVDVRIVFYSLFAPFQEFVARGAMQSSLQRFLTGRYANLRAILVVTLVFGAHHLWIDTSFGFLTLIPSLLWGAMYARQGSLFGVSVSHIIIGDYVCFIMGLPGLRY
jgi:CRP-like cAMP-binding protein